MQPKLCASFSAITKQRLRWVIIIAAIIVIIGISIRIMNYIKLYHGIQQQANLPVAVIQAQAGAAIEEIVLPGNIVAWHETTIYARTNGYVTQWFTDIGAKVKAGQVLAIIATPEMDKALKQAEADYHTAKANNHLAQTTARRWQILLKTHSVSKQETDEKVSDAKASAATLAAARANRDRLRDLVSYERVIAPFNGIIMARNTDIGRLINAGSDSLRPLFRIVQAEQLRIYIRVPQLYATRVNPNLIGELHLTEYPGKVFQAKLLTTAKAIDSGTRTLLIQLVMDNQHDTLLPGSYTLVHLKFPSSKNNVRLPVNTLLFRAQGLQVATIDGDHTVVLKSITIGRDFGDTVEVVAGIKPNETIIVNPPDALVSGQKVHIVSLDGINKGAG